MGIKKFRLSGTLVMHRVRCMMPGVRNPTEPTLYLLITLTVSPLVMFSKFLSVSSQYNSALHTHILLHSYSFPMGLVGSHVTQCISSYKGKAVNKSTLKLEYRIKLKMVTNTVTKQYIILKKVLLFAIGPCSET